MHKKNTLTPKINQITQLKGTEPSHSGQYNVFNEIGSFLCRQCGQALFRSDQKFTASCGWPSFDDNLEHKIKTHPDKDGQRTEILCANCNAHLGHVFKNEHYTPKNTRFCVNSLALEFVQDINIDQTEEAIFAGGCFWGIEHYFQHIEGVLKTEVGYTGGSQPSPSYQQVCSGNTQHVEATRILYDPKKITYQQLTQLFFEIHDPTQANGQGRDIGAQYKSIIFYFNQSQYTVAHSLMDDLKQYGYRVVTQLVPASTFWPAEPEHQQYYEQHAEQTSCHRYTPRFPKETK